MRALVASLSLIVLAGCSLFDSQVACPDGYVRSGGVCEPGVDWTPFDGGDAVSPDLAADVPSQEDVGVEPDEGLADSEPDADAAPDPDASPDVESDLEVEPDSDVESGRDDVDVVERCGDSDSDRDGVGDLCDQCDGFDDTVDEDEDGLPDACDPCLVGDESDMDSDGVPDACDCDAVDFSCVEFSHCEDSRHGAACFCIEGFEMGDRSECVDVDECERGTDVCDGDARCLNTVGHYECSCAAGFVGDGEICVTEDSVCTPAPDAECSGAGFHGEDFPARVLDGIDFSDADLSSSDLSFASFVGANFDRANLSLVNCTGTDFGGSSMNDVVLNEAVCDSASFREASLVGAALVGGDFSHVDFSGADLGGADVTDADFTSAIFSRETTCPDGTTGAETPECGLR